MSIDTMKKLGLSLFVILMFVAYSFQQRNGDEASAIVTPNTSSIADQSTITATTQGDTTASTNSSNTSSSQQTISNYKDGTYTGTRADAVYGYIQVQTTISGGKITKVTFLEYPNDHRESVQINQQAMPYLQQEAIQAQSAQVDGVSGATDTSQAFVESLSAALNKAKA
jgi:uncharacterized protein with FMN-binding domain